MLSAAGEGVGCRGGKRIRDRPDRLFGASGRNGARGFDHPGGRAARAVDVEQDGADAIVGERCSQCGRQAVIRRPATERGEPVKFLRQNAGDRNDGDAIRGERILNETIGRRDGIAIDQRQAIAAKIAASLAPF